MKKVLYLLSITILGILMSSNSWAFLKYWNFKPDGNDNIISQYLNTIGATWVKNDVSQQGQGTFEEWGVFKTFAHDDGSQYSFDGSGEVTGIMYATGTVSLGGTMRFNSGWLKIYYDNDLNTYPFTDASSQSDSIYYGANDGDLIASFSLSTGWGSTDVTGVPNGMVTTIWTAEDLAQGVWIDSNGQDLANTSPISWILGFGTTNASWNDTPLLKLKNELAEFSGYSATNMTNSPPADLFVGGDGQFRLSKVPEPATMFLLGSGLIGFVGIGRKKFKRNKA